MHIKAGILTTLLLLSAGGIRLHAQCEPDVGCTDPEGNGQFCPAEIPPGVVNEEYDLTVTIIPPASFELMGGSVTILHFRIDSVRNLPPGLDLEPTGQELYPDASYCVQLSGTPTESGDYSLALFITATIDFLETPTEIPVVDDTSLVITIQEPAGIKLQESAGFTVFQNAPNPFTTGTRLGFFSPRGQKMELSIFNILGVRVYNEILEASPGVQYFDFDGTMLKAGSYIFRVSNTERIHTGKMVKSR